VLAAAAYNAGPTRARLWRGSVPVEGAIFVETIPFGETRDYVKKVMANTVYYAAVLGTEPTPLKTRLGTVLPRRTSEGVAAIRDAPVVQ
jgi:soluble lytic murein transglycosylase